MDLTAQYDAMRTAALHQLAQGTAELDPHLRAAHDGRRGITLLARPPAAIAEIIGSVLADFQIVEPNQYYYPAADLHFTILSLISCYEGFSLAAIDPAAYRAVVGDVLQRTRPFGLTLAGLTASPAGILVQGFPQGSGLAELRTNLRTAFRASGLAQSIDQRYRLETAHLTVARFCTKILDSNLLISLLLKHQHCFIGSFEVSSLELVFNDWYQRAANTTVLEQYSLPAPTGEAGRQL